MIAFEFRKLFKNKYTILFILLMLVINGTLFCLNTKQDVLYQGGYPSYFHHAQQQENSSAWLKEQQDILIYYQQNPSDPFNSEAKQVQQKDLHTYGKTWIQKRNKEVAKLRYDNIDIVLHRQSALAQVTKEFKNAQQYPTWKKGFQTRLQQLNGISIFQQDHNRDAIATKTIAKYSKLNIHKIHAQPSIGIQNALFFMPVDILILLFMMYLIIQLVCKEEESGVATYYKSMIKGRKKLYFVKAGVLCSTVAMFVLICMVETIVMATLAYGSVDLMAPVQSLSFLSTSPYAISILQFLLYITGIRIITFWVFTMAIIVVANWRKAIVGLLCVAAILYGGSYVLYGSFTAISTLSPLHEFNFYFLLHPIELFNSYDFYAVGGILLSHWIVICIIPIFFLLLLWLGYYIYRKQTKQRRNRKGRELFHFNRCLGLWKQELVKTLCKDAGILILLVTLVVGVRAVWKEGSCTSVNDIYYDSFVNTIGSHVSAQADANIKKQESVYRSLQKQLTQEKSQEGMSAIQRQLDSQSAFATYLQNYNLRKKEKTNRVIPKEDWYRLFMIDSPTSTLIYFLVLTALLLMVVQSYHREYVSKMNTLQDCSIHRKRLHFQKSMTIGILASALSIVLQLIHYIHIDLLYPTLSLQLPINTLASYFHSGLRIPLWMYLLLTLFTQVIVIFFLTSVLVMVLKRFQHHVIVLFVAFLLCLFPMLLPMTLHGFGLRSVYHIYAPQTWLTQYAFVYYIGIVLIAVFTSIRLRTWCK